MESIGFPSGRFDRDHPARLAVLLSGRGSNFLALAEACRDGRLPATVVGVLSDRPEAAGLSRAGEMGIPARGIDRRAFPDRASHEAEVLRELRLLSPDLVCLAGYMRLLSPDFVEAFPRRIVNIHPSLLPAFPGTHSQRQALEWGVRFSGCTVHLVDAGLDSGPILAQRVVPVLDRDDESALSERILVAEHETYVEAVRLLLTGPAAIQGRRVVFEPGQGIPL